MKMRFCLLFGLLFAHLVPAVHAIAYRAGAGVLSYTFFNLSPANCTLTPLGAGYPAGTGPNWNGWTGTAGMFNAPFGGRDGSPESLVTQSYIFYNGTDPIGQPAAGTRYSLAQGQSQSITEPSLYFDHPQNPAAMGDLWKLNCDTPAGKQTPPVQWFGALASASNLLASNVGAKDYPYDMSQKGVFENAAVNPFDSGTCTASNPATDNPCPISLYGFDPNRDSAGTMIPMSYNLNLPTSSTRYKPSGGLWLGVNTGVSTGSTVRGSYLLNPAMLPVNLSTYVKSDSFQTAAVVNGQSQISTPLFGAHLTLALGDPYVVESFAAKMLWSAVQRTIGSLNSADLSIAHLTSLLRSQDNAGNGPLFAPGSIGDRYLGWLLDSPRLGAAAYQSAFKAASIPVVKESVWGWVFLGLLGAISILIVVATAIILPAFVALLPALGLIYSVPGWALIIYNSDLRTLSGPPPVSADAPLVMNSTYASKNLLGMLLTNVGMQQAIYQALGQTPTVNPLWANYALNTEALCDSDLQVSLGVYWGHCHGPGDPSGTVTYNAPDSGQSGYSNVLAAQSYGGSTALNYWDAVLTGADVTTDAAGRLMLGESLNGMNSFTPPVQMINATNGTEAPTAAINSSISASTSFNLETGYLSLDVFRYDGPPLDVQNPAPAASPQLNLALGGVPPAGVAFTGAHQLSYQNGVVSVQGYTGSYQGVTYPYTFANGTQTLDIRGCDPNAQVKLTITPNPASGNPWGASGALSCVWEIPVNSIALDYARCTRDPWASGGVFVMVDQVDARGLPLATSLYCACVPDYLDGPAPNETAREAGQLRGGLVVGASSLLPGRSCPVPGS